MSKDENHKAFRDLWQKIDAEKEDERRAQERWDRIVGVLGALAGLALAAAMVWAVWRGLN